MANRHPSSFAKRAREAAKRAKKQQKAERQAQRKAEREQGIEPEAIVDDDIDWSAAVGIDPPPGALAPRQDDGESAERGDADEDDEAEESRPD